MSKLIRESVLIILFITAISGFINIKYIVKVSINIITFATVILLFQYIFYYIFSFHMQVVPTSLLLNSANQWVKLAQTGRISVTGTLMQMYRPSAFFLEPSHFSIYCFPAMVTLLLTPNMTRKRLYTAIFLTLGMLLTTSGMGIIISIVIWLIYIGLYVNENKNTTELANILKPNNILFFLLFITLITILYLTNDLFKVSVNRIFLNPAGGTNAIEARTSTGIRTLMQISGSEFWLGRKNLTDFHQWNMSGFFYTFYEQGFIGVVLSYAFYIFGLFKLKRQYFWMCFMIIIISFFTVHTYAAFYKMFFVVILLEGYKTIKTQEEKMII